MGAKEAPKLQLQAEEEAVKPAEVEGKKEETTTSEEQKPEEIIVYVEEPKPPSPFILSIDLHCVGCAKKIERSILKIRGVEGVVVDMVLNQVIIKGVVEPQAVCSRIMKRTKRKVKVLSPLPPADGEPIPQIVASQVSGLSTVELNVNMHCDACAEQLKRRILKMKGVRTAETDITSEKITVTGTMDANKLVDYVYRHTKKQAKIVPQPEPEKAQEEELAKPAAEGETKEEADHKPAAGAEEPKPAEEKYERSTTTTAEKPAEDGGEGQKDSDILKEVDPTQLGGSGEEYYYHTSNINYDFQTPQKMIYYYQCQPLYFIERIPPPQLFSDENPNACSIL